MFSQVLLLILAIVVMLISAKMLLDLIEKIYKYFSLSSFAAGVLFFGFIFAVPGLIFSLLAVQQGDFGTVLGLMIGMMVNNLFLVYGISGFFGRLLILRKEILNQFLFQLAAVLLLGPILLFGYYHVAYGIVLLAFFIFFLLKLPYCEKNVGDTVIPLSVGVWLKTFMALSVLMGAEVYLILRGQEIGQGLEVSSFVISTVVIGFIATLPQLFVSLIAIITKKHTDVITGNIIGSNFFNGCLMLGLVCFYNFDYKRDLLTEWIILLLGAFCLVLLVKIKRNFYRISGAIFLTFYLSLIFYWSAYSS
ncbi:MAG: hypothetical protein HYV97_08965 [Bdellovibrio sp.]|nr:hypothetical protein [Bdellovibrio sp.]